MAESLVLPVLRCFVVVLRTKQQCSSLKRIFLVGHIGIGVEKKETNLQFHTVTVYWHWTNQSQHWTHNFRCRREQSADYSCLSCLRYLAMIWSEASCCRDGQLDLTTRRSGQAPFVDNLCIAVSFPARPLLQSSPVCYWSLRIECCSKFVCWLTPALQQSGDKWKLDETYLYGWLKFSWSSHLVPNWFAKSRENLDSYEASVTGLPVTRARRAHSSDN